MYDKAGDEEEEDLGHSVNRHPCESWGDGASPKWRQERNRSALNADSETCA